MITTEHLPHIHFPHCFALLPKTFGFNLFLAFGTILPLLTIKEKNNLNNVVVSLYIRKSFLKISVIHDNLARKLYSCTGLCKLCKKQVTLHSPGSCEEFYSDHWMEQKDAEIFAQVDKPNMLS